jgi:hypothetical protein
VHPQFRKGRTAVYRVRLTYAKRGRACFIPHIAIPSIFSRSGARAGISFQLSEGFSPRPRISLGPELPVGVPALAEPLEVRLASLGAEDIVRWNRSLPPGFSFTGACIVAADPGSEEAKSLNKWCEASSCILALRAEVQGGPQELSGASEMTSFLEELHQAGEILFFETVFPELSRTAGRASGETDLTLPDRKKTAPERFFRCVMANPAQRSPGLLVKALQKRGIIKGWPDVFILREAVGRLSSSPEGIPCVFPLTSSASGLLLPVSGEDA